MQFTCVCRLLLLCAFLVVTDMACTRTRTHACVGRIKSQFEGVLAGGAKFSAHRVSFCLWLCDFRLCLCRGHLSLSVVCLQLICTSRCVLLHVREYIFARIQHVGPYVISVSILFKFSDTLLQSLSSSSANLTRV